MDKRKVIAAYRRGFMNVKECAQVLGIDASQLAGLLSDPYLTVEPHPLQTKQISG